MQTLEILNKTINKKISKVYDIEVDECHHYIIDNGVISHNSYIPQNVISGGSGAVYPMSQIIELSKRSDKEDKDQIGVILKAKTTKSRLTKEGKTIELLLNFSTGLHRYYGLLELALKYGIFKSVSTRIELPDGSKTFGKTINKNPEKFFTDDILQQLNQCANLEYKYGSVSVIDDDNEEEDHHESIEN